MKELLKYSKKTHFELNNMKIRDTDYNRARESYLFIKSNKILGWLPIA